MVIWDHEVPQKTAMHIPASVLHTTVGCDICLEEPYKVKTLALESTLNTVLEVNKTVALVVNATSSPVKLKQGVLFSHARAYDGQIVPEHFELSHTCIGARPLPARHLSQHHSTLLLNS